MDIKIVLNSVKAKEIGYDVDDCYDVIDKYFLENDMKQSSQYIYSGENFEIFSMFLESILKTNWFYRIVDECIWFDNHYIFYDYHNNNVINFLLNVHFEISEEFCDDMKLLSYLMEKNGFSKIDDTTYISNDKIDVISCFDKCIYALNKMNTRFQYEFWKKFINKMTISYQYDDEFFCHTLYRNNIHPLGVVPIRCSIVFLDIDGVLQPISSANRFQIDRKRLREEIAYKYSDDTYLDMDEYDIAAVFVDWKKSAVLNLKKLLKKHSTKIVVSSAWKESRTFDELLKLFRLHDLDKEVIDIINYTSYCYSDCTNLIQLTDADIAKVCQIYKLDHQKYYKGRVSEILRYLIDHQEVKQYVILDDMKLEALDFHFLWIDGYDGHKHYFDNDFLEIADIILNQNKDIPKLKNVIFLDIDGVISPDIFAFKREMRKEYNKIYNQDELLEKYFYTFQTILPEARNEYDKYKSYYQNRSDKLKKEDIYVNDHDIYLAETFWSLDAVALLKEVLDETDSQIVIESSWATYDEKRMKYLLSLVGLDQYYVGNAIGYNKREGVNRFLKLHREIDNYVIIDDEDYWNFSKDYGGRLVRPVVALDERDCMIVRDIFNHDI